jgi:hypothetical protein
LPGECLETIAERIRRSGYFARFVSPAATVAAVGEGEPQLIRTDLHHALVRRARPGRTIFVVGGPGSGKTTLWHTLTEAAVRKDPPLVPVRFNVHWLARHETREDIIRASLGGLLSEDQIVALDRDRRLLILIDGLNEIAYSTRVSERARTAIADMLDGPEQCPVIATTRAPVPGGLRLPDSYKQSVQVVLHQFDEQQLDEVVRKHGLDVASFRPYLGTSRLAELAGNPHLLTMLIEVFRAEPEEPAPGSVVQLVQRFFELKWQQSRDAIDHADVLQTPFVKALATLAWHMRVEGRASVPPAEWSDLLSPVAERLERDGIDIQSIIDRAHAYYVMELEDGNLQFLNFRKF